MTCYTVSNVLNMLKSDMITGQVRKLIVETEKEICQCLIYDAEHFFFSRMLGMCFVLVYSYSYYF